MSSSRLRKIALRWTPRLVSLSVLLAIFCSMAPLAVGQQSVKDLSEPFPCQHRACGCRSAAQCWKRCCCFSNAQKVAWARAHKVEPPQYVVASLEREQSPAKCDSTGCCHLSSTTSSTDTSSGATPVDQVASPADTIYVIALLAHQCAGHNWYWNALPWSILPAAEITQRSPQSDNAKVDLSSEKLSTYSQQPPVPPPR